SRVCLRSRGGCDRGSCFTGGWCHLFGQNQSGSVCDGIGGCAVAIRNSTQCSEPRIYSGRVKCRLCGRGGPGPCCVCIGNGYSRIGESSGGIPWPGRMETHARTAEQSWSCAG